jgi:hypothetical protein
MSLAYQEFSYKSAESRILIRGKVLDVRGNFFHLPLPRRKDLTTLFCFAFLLLSRKKLLRGLSLKHQATVALIITNVK